MRSFRIVGIEAKVLALNLHQWTAVTKFRRPTSDAFLETSALAPRERTNWVGRGILPKTGCLP